MTTFVVVVVVVGLDIFGCLFWLIGCSTCCWCFLEIFGCLGVGRKGGDLDVVKFDSSLSIFLSLTLPYSQVYKL